MTEPYLLATRSLGKLYELRPMWAEAGLEVIDLDAAGIAEGAAEEALEEFETFEENALAKAKYFRAKSGLVTIADDSGLEVQALGGAPGVRTKRWSGRSDLEGRALDVANNNFLLNKLEKKTDRRARYVCVAALVDGGGQRTFRGETEGEILEAPRGAGGFGYDPLFLSSDLGITFAEADRAAKEQTSHRGRAFSQLIAWLSARARVGRT
ncbi:MAG TPA: non-canonical purine NTP pyrophosphatase [Gemmatimonadaceae bacterium]|nr:non-canonical purine NTP pyrophosphatase [Gemmatimonadaceae bacterium]